MAGGGGRHHGLNATRVSERPTCRVVIVTHDSDATLRRCVEGVLAQQAVELDVRIVDNASQRDPTGLLTGLQRCSVERNATNPGFSAACNQGARDCEAGWLLFLNPDCFLEPGQLERLIAVGASIPELGVLGAQLLNEDQTPQAASIRRAPRARDYLPWVKRQAMKVEPIEGSADDTVRVEAISGALMLMHATTFQAIGGLDEGYRLHCEDLDLCKRLELAGKTVACATAICVVHVKGTSSRRRPIWVEWQKHRGMWRYFCKFERDTAPAWLVAVVALGIALRFPIAALLRR